MAIKVLHPGLATSVQDLGRPGYFHLGIPLGGAMDRLALKAANLAQALLTLEANLDPDTYDVTVAGTSNFYGNGYMFTFWLVAVAIYLVMNLSVSWLGRRMAGVVATRRG